MGPLTKEQLAALRDAADHAINTARQLQAEAHRQREASLNATEQLDTEREHLRERGTQRRTKS